MTGLFLVARLLLALVFVLAGLTKLRDSEGTRQTLLQFGAPDRLARPVAVALPLAELAVAVLLFPATTAEFGAIAALALLGIFSTAIAWNLAHGRTPECHCFGQLHSAPVGWKALGRNAVLALVAAVGLVGAIEEPHASAAGWIGALDGTELAALTVAVCAVALLVVGTFAFVTLMRSYGRVLVSLDRLEAAVAAAGIEIAGDEPMPEIGREPGSPAPAFSTTTLAGETVTLESLTAAGEPTLLLFTSARCGPCKTLLPTAAEWQHEHAEALRVVFVTDGSVDEALLEAEEFELENVLLDPEGTLYDGFEARGTPSAVLIATDGTIGSWVASGSKSIERLVEDATARPPEDEGLPVGSPAPDIELTTLEGESASVSELRGEDALLLFWNPDCGFCRSMHEALLGWEASRSGNGQTPELVVVSSGDAESSRQEGFRSRVWLDEDFSAGSAFGANGTPMAVLIDAEGRIASGVVAGPDAVLALARTEPAQL